MKVFLIAAIVGVSAFYMGRYEEAKDHAYMYKMYVFAHEHKMNELNRAYHQRIRDLRAGKCDCY